MFHLVDAASSIASDGASNGPSAAFKGLAAASNAHGGMEGLRGPRTGGASNGPSASASVAPAGLTSTSAAHWVCGCDGLLCFFVHPDCGSCRLQSAVLCLLILFLLLINSLLASTHRQVL